MSLTREDDFQDLKRKSS